MGGYFLDPDGFPQLRALRETFDAIRREALAVADSPAGWHLWPDLASYGGSGRWLVFPLALSQSETLFEGLDLAANRARCPSTWSALAQLDRLALAGFSMLEPGAEIHAHVDAPLDEPGLRAHLTLDARPNAWTRIGDELREARVGDCYVIDGRIEHQVANFSGAPRLHLLVDFALTAKEQRTHEAWFEAQCRADPKLLVPTPNRVVPRP